MIYINSKVINAFIKKIENIISSVRNELKSKTTKLVLPSVKVVVFNDKKKLGYYHRIMIDEGSYRHIIAINKNLVYQAKDRVLSDIVRHELAHLLLIHNYDDVSKPHGKEFTRICKLIGAKPDAKSNIQKENQNLNDEVETEKLINKVKKLLNLSSSSNKNESELATLKANQLLLKHNLKFYDEKDELHTIELLHRSQKLNTKIRMIINILQTFNVYPVINYENKYKYVTFSGSKASVEIVEYIADFLDSEFDRLWDKYKKENKLKGLRAKNSFFRGIYEGYISKLENIKSNYTKEEALALIKYEEELSRKVNDIVFYNKRLRKGKTSRYLNDVNANSLGKNAGSRLQIKKGLKNNKSTSTKPFLIGD
jgi:hypothetical protein